MNDRDKKFAIYHSLFNFAVLCISIVRWELATAAFAAFYLVACLAYYTFLLKWMAKKNDSQKG